MKNLHKWGGGYYKTCSGEREHISYNSLYEIIWKICFDSLYDYELSIKHKCVETLWNLWIICEPFVNHFCFLWFGNRREKISVKNTFEAL